MLRPDLDGVVLVGRSEHRDRDLVVGALGVGEQLHRQVGAGAGQRVGQVGQGRRDPAGAAGQDGHRVVGGHAPVGVEPVEADPGRRAQRGVEVGGVDHGVGGEDDEHRGELGREHAGALGHAADAPAAAVDDDLLADRVGGHDRLGRVGAAVRAEGVVRRVDAGEHGGAVVGEPDQPGGADHDVDRADAEVVGDPLGDGVGGLEAVGAGVAVGAAGVEDDRADDAVLDAPARLHSTGLALQRLAVKTLAESWRGPSLTTRATSLAPVRLESGGDARGAEARGGAVTAHGASPTVVRPVVSSRPEGEVEALDGGAAGALGEVVDRADGDQPAGAPRRRSPGGGRRWSRAPTGSAATGPRAAAGRTARRRTPCRTPPARRRRSRRRPAGPSRWRGCRADIGTSIGVKLTPTGAAGDAGEVLDDLGGVPVDAADAVRAGAAHDLAAEQVRLGGLAGAAGAGRGHDDDVGLDQAGRDGRSGGQGGDGRVAAGDGDPGRAAQLLALPGQLGQAVGPGAGVVAAVEPAPTGRRPRAGGRRRSR